MKTKNSKKPSKWLQRYSLFRHSDSQGCLNDVKLALFWGFITVLLFNTDFKEQKSN